MKTTLNMKTISKNEDDLKNKENHNDEGGEGCKMSSQSCKYQPVTTNLNYSGLGCDSLVQ